MRIVIHGQQAFGKAVFEALLERGEEIIAVYVAPEKEGRPTDPLKEAALARGLPVHQPASFKKPEVWKAFRELKPDLCVMAFVTLIVPEEFLDIPSMGSIQYHPSLLPRHRGPSSINWPIIQGETRTGLSIFWPDNGLDTGPILLQKEVEIAEQDTLGSLYFDRLFPLGVAAMLEAVDLVKGGSTPKIAQDESQASYEGWCTAEEVAIDWQRPAPEIHTLIRGSDPQPGAWTTLKAERLQLYGATRLTSPTDAPPGTVTAIGDDGLTIAASDGAIRVAKLRPARGKKLAAAAFAAQSGLTVGTVLG
jgi:methionyl-tRNA formyltransferase